MKKLITSFLIIIIFFSLPGFAQTIFYNNISACYNGDVYSIDYEYYVPDGVKITNVVLNISNCIFDWNFIEKDRVIFISIASAEALKTKQNIVTVISDIECKLVFKKALINGTIKATEEDITGTGGTETAKPPEPVPVTRVYNKPYTFKNQNNEDETVPSGVAFAKLAEDDGYILKEYGMLFANKDITKDNFIIESEFVKKAVGKAIGTSGRYFGILFYGPGVKYGITYYTLPYAIYEDANGKLITVYGNSIISFIPEM